MTPRIWSRDDCIYAGCALDLAGGRILRTPVTYWRGEGWDLRTFSSDRIALVPDGSPMSSIGRPVTPRMLAALPAALAEYAEYEDVRADIQTLDALASALADR
jgi:hypothetical protein